MVLIITSSDCTSLLDIRPCQILTSSLRIACAWASRRPTPSQTRVLSVTRTYATISGTHWAANPWSGAPSPSDTIALCSSFSTSHAALASSQTQRSPSLAPDSEFFFARETILVDFSGTHPHTHADTPLLPECSVRHREEAGLQDNKVLRTLSPTQFPLCCFCMDSYGQLPRLRRSRLPRQYRSRSIHAWTS